MQNVKEQIDRLKIVYSKTTDVSLAEVLCVDKNTVSGWKSRKAVPMAVFKKVSQNENISLDWLLTGDGSMKLSGDSIYNIIGQTLHLDSDDTARVVQELLSDADMREMIELLPYASKEFIGSVKNRLEEFKKLSKI
jgi:hypothetical protein